MIIEIYDKADEVIQETFESLLSRNRTGIEEPMKERDRIFGCFNLLHHKFHKWHLKSGEWYMDSPDLIKNKKTTMIILNSINDNNKLFRCVATVPLHRIEVGKKLKSLLQINITGKG